VADRFVLLRARGHRWARTISPSPRAGLGASWRRTTTSSWRTRMAGGGAATHSVTRPQPTRPVRARSRGNAHALG